MDSGSAFGPSDGESSVETRARLCWGLLYFYLCVFVILCDARCMYFSALVFVLVHKESASGCQDGESLVDTRVRFCRRQFTGIVTEDLMVSYHRPNERPGDAKPI